MPNDLPKQKRILCIDFDGVLHSYTSGWKGPRNIPDPPVVGAMPFLAECINHFQVCIYSSRSRYIFSRRAMKQWLQTNLETYYCESHPDLIKTALDADPFPDPPEAPWTLMAKDVVRHLKFPNRKPPAHLLIDDRAICFNGTWPLIKDIKSFKPWYKR